MRLSLFRTTFVFCLASFAIGVAPMNAEPKSTMQSNWLDIVNEKESCQISFPGQPFELRLNVPFNNSFESGQLHIYSGLISEEKGVLILSILSSPEITEEFLEADKFKENFSNYLMNYLYNEPNLFKILQTSTCKLQDVQGNPLLSFKFCYGEELSRKMIQGIAVVHESKLYQVFYSASEKHYDEEVLEKFIANFHINEN